MTRRKMIAVNRSYQVRRNGATYEFSMMHDPEYVSEMSGTRYRAMTQYVARKWTGREWVTLHNFTVEH